MTQLLLEATKECRSCGYDLLLSCYSYHPQTRDRLQGVCKQCVRAAVRASVKCYDECPCCGGVKSSSAPQCRTCYQGSITHCPHGHEYTPENTKSNGQGGKVCKTCAKENTKRRKLVLIAQAAAIIDQAKDRPCVDCGVQYHPAAMQFDHVRGQKLYTISRWRSNPRTSMETLVAEIAKCDIRCANCHATRHALEREAAAA